MQTSLRNLVSSLGLFLAVVGGCNSNHQASNDHDDHGHSHDHHDSDTPESLRAAIIEVRDMWKEISTSMEKNEPDSVHEPLHDVGHVLEAIPDLAAETDLSEDEWNEIKGEVDKLFDAFGDIDSAFHKKDADKLAAYESAKSTINDGVAALEDKLPLLAEDSPADHRNHDDHEHELNDDHSHDDHKHGQNDEHATAK